MARPCKICKLKKTNKKAYKKITIHLKNGKISTAKFVKIFNEEFNLDIIPMNVSRHKTHMEGNVIEIKGEDIRKEALSVELTNTDQSVFNLSFPNLDPKHEKFLLAYRARGYKDKELAYKDAGFKGAKGAYEMIQRPELQAALNEMKAVDFIQLKITGNQIIAGLGKIAYYTDHLDKIVDNDGRIITNIKKWPEEVRCALNAIEMTEDVVQGSEEDLILKRRFKFKFESHLKARQELRKHFMEVESFKKGEDKQKIYEQIIEKLILNQINPIAAGLEMDKHKINVPPAVRIAMQKVDPGVLDKPPLTDTEDMSSYSDEELRRIAEKAGNE